MKDEFLLYKVNILNKYYKFFTMFNSKSCYDNIENILPLKVYEEYSKDIDEANTQLKNLDSSLNYLDKFNYNQKIFDSLFPVKMNTLAYKAFKEIESNETIISTIKSFKPRKGYANVVSYDQIKTVTGRLINEKNSPRILTLPARCRKIFDTRWGQEGSLLYLDFKNLEPRVLRKINGKESPDDIYTDISKDLSFETDRLVIKRAIISILYGSSQKIQGLSETRSNEVLEAVKEYFDVERIVKEASKVNEIGCRNNFFGRPIWNIDETKENKIMNNYVQSTAVDVALSYFSEICYNIDFEFAKPVFIIHDGLVVDVHNSYKECFVNLINKGYTCDKLGYFPIDITNLLETTIE